MEQSLFAAANVREATLIEVDQDTDAFPAPRFTAAFVIRSGNATGNKRVIEGAGHAFVSAGLCFIAGERTKGITPCFGQKLSPPMMQTSVGIPQSRANWNNLKQIASTHARTSSVFEYE